MKASLAVVLGSALTLAACSDKKTAPSTSTQPSPNASILPAPLASTLDISGATPARSGAVEGIPADSAGRLMLREAPPPPPEIAPIDRALPDDALTPKDGAGYTVTAAFHWADVPALQPLPEMAAPAIRDAASKTGLGVSVDLAGIGRMRFSLESAVFPLPAHSELRARTGYYGHALVWPSGSSYRVLAPGSLRAMFAERRADVAPLLRAKLSPGDPGSLLGHKTLRTNVETALGTLLLEQATLPGSGAGGELLCRLLVELVGAEPKTDACGADRIPLAAEYKWAPSGSLSFVATDLVERKDMPTGYLYMPPPGARFTPGELPPPTSGVFLTQGDLAKFRTRAVRNGAPSARSPGEGITAGNETSVLQYLLLDGVPVGWVRPRTTQYVIGPPAGRYSVSWRDFFGTMIAAPAVMDLPAFVRIGTPEPDGGARP